MTVRERDVDELIADTAMLPDEDDSRSYVSDEIASDVIASYFRAAASLVRSNPWRDLADEEVLLAVSVPSLGVSDQLLTLVDGIRGLLCFETLDDYELYMDAAAGHVEAETPAHLTMAFLPGSDLSEGLRQQVATKQWELAHEDTYPWLASMDDTGSAHAPTQNELTFAEAVCWALPAFLQDNRDAVLAALDGGEHIERSLSVQTHAGETTITFRLPHPDVEELIEPGMAMAQLSEAARAGDLESSVRAPFERALMIAFASSPEGMRLAEPQLCRLVMDMAARELDETIATLEAPELSRLVFEILPAKIQSDALRARWIAEVTRAFYRFLQRTTNLPQADTCIRALTTGLERPLDAGAAKKLKNQRKAARQASKKRR